MCSSWTCMLAQMGGPACAELWWGTLKRGQGLDLLKFRTIITSSLSGWCWACEKVRSCLLELLIHPKFRVMEWPWRGFFPLPVHFKYSPRLQRRMCTLREGSFHFLITHFTYKNFRFTKPNLQENDLKWESTNCFFFFLLLCSMTRTMTMKRCWKTY